MNKVQTGKSLWLVLGILILALPLKWLVAVATSIAVHELCHYYAVRMCGGHVYSMRISATGMQMRTSSLSPGKELFCSLAGPAGGVLLFFLSMRMPRLALCALIHSAYNLIPLYPMDGGRAVENLLLLLFPRYGPRIFLWLERVLGAVIVVICLWASLVQKLGIIPLILAAGVLAKSEFLK